jgi:DNA-binding IclR family transcriptional regulator
MVERAFRLLDLLSSSEDGLTLSDLARSLGMGKSSIHGLLKTLESSRAVALLDDRRYVLGPRLYDLTQNYIQRAGLRHFALPALYRLAFSTGETVCLGKVERQGVCVIECYVDEEIQEGLHIAVRRGMRIPLLAGATGACVMANWPAHERETCLQTYPPQRYTGHTITDVPTVLARIEQVSATGYALDHQEYLDGVNAVAAPIYGAGGVLVALLWVVGFASRLEDSALADAAADLLTEAQTISHALGNPG